MNGSIMGMTQGGVTRKLDEGEAFAGVKIYRYSVKRYSSGMTVRLEFAIAHPGAGNSGGGRRCLACGRCGIPKEGYWQMQDVERRGTDSFVCRVTSMAR